MRPPSSKKRIALSLHWPFSYGWRIVQGVLSFSRQQPDWQIVTPFLMTGMQSIHRHQKTIDGVIAGLNTPGELEFALDMDRPIINISNTLRHPPLPTVTSDDHAIGTTAARFFLERLYPHFAFCGFHGHNYSHERCIGYETELKANGVKTVHHFSRLHEYGKNAVLVLDELEDWLRTLPLPCAVFACSDPRALHISQACEMAGIRVPQEISILGVDDEEYLTSMYGLALSSIAQDAERIGYESCRLLQRALSGDPPEHGIRLQPHGVVSRDTTLAQVRDPLTQRAVEALEAHAFRNSSVESILSSIGTTRRTVERRFKSQIGSSPKQYLLKLKLNRARELLVTTRLGIGEVAEAVGFEEHRRLCELFRNELKTTPSDYRRAHTGYHAAQKIR